MKKFLFIFTAFTLFTACDNSPEYDASGTFEAEELIVAAQANGEILELKIEEGQQLIANQQVGLIDTKNLELQKQQMQERIDALSERTGSATPQVQVLQRQAAAQRANISVIEEQLQNAMRERDRTANLVSADAATQKQLDDANGTVEVLQKQVSAARVQLTTLNQQISAAEENVAIQNRAVLSERRPTQTGVEQIEEAMKNNVISSPVDGTVLTQYMFAGEFVNTGKPIFKIANLEEMILRVYLTGDQLAQAKVGQQVKVLVDAGNGESRELNGTISWIAQHAEFTPKTIQTKDERANLVYAAKVKVKNDGFLKIGMYGEIVLNPNQNQD